MMNNENKQGPGVFIVEKIEAQKMEEKMRKLEAKKSLKKGQGSATLKNTKLAKGKPGVKDGALEALEIVSRTTADCLGVRNPKK